MQSILISEPVAAFAVGLMPANQVSSGEPLGIAGGCHDHWGGPRPHTAVMAADPPLRTDAGEPTAWQQVETLGVADVVMSILKAQSGMPWASAAAVWRQRRDGGVYVLVTLLERPPSARPGGGPAEVSGRAQVIAEFAAQRLGEDRVTAFGANDVIILQ